MKKSLVLALVVCFVLSLAGTALAFPVDFKGDFRLQGRVLDDKISAVTPLDTSFFQLRARLGFEGKVDENTAFFGRFTTRNAFGENVDNGSQGALDQYGVKLNADSWKFTIGRQAVNLGQGTIISTGYDAAGVDNKFDGLVASTKSGNFDLNIIAGKTNKTSVPAGNGSQWYGFDASTKVDDKFSFGAAYAHSKLDSVAARGVKSWAVNATVAPAANFSLNGEYAKSDANTLNKAYFLAGTYSWEKSSFTVQYQKVDVNAVDNYNSGIGAVAYPFGRAIIGAAGAVDGYKGFTYVYNQTMTKSTSFHVIYMDLKAVGTATGADKELAAGVVWKF